MTGLNRSRNPDFERKQQQSIVQFSFLDRNTMNTLFFVRFLGLIYFAMVATRSGGIMGSGTGKGTGCLAEIRPENGEKMNN